MDDDKATAIFGLGCFIFALFIGLWIGLSSGRHIMEQQAIEKGYAQYRTDTGEWTWKCDLEKQIEK